MNAHVNQSAAPVVKAEITPASTLLLQRKCVCGGSAGLASDCEDCHRKRLTGVQAKRALSQPGDRWEQEADRVAADVLAGHGPDMVRSATPLAGQALMRLPTSAGSTAGVPESVQSVLQTPGQPLDAEIRSFMEPRFGHDFSRVRVHADTRATESARAVNALAYTVGRDVVFATGQYSPQTRSGRSLLAHELAHTLQQGTGTPLIRRQASPFSVTGLYENRGDPVESDFVYFDLGRPSTGDSPPEGALDLAEQAKATDKGRAAVQANQNEMTLYGFASEEGGAGVNTPLIEHRLDAVQNLLDQAGFRPPDRTVHRQTRLACSANKYNYRFWRVVEMRNGSNQSQRLCEGTKPEACEPEIALAINTIRTDAWLMIAGTGRALERLKDYIEKEPKDPQVAAALRLYFGNDDSVKTAGDVRDRVAAVGTVLETLGPTGQPSFKCGTMDEPTCRTGSPANASRRYQSITICPTFFNNPKNSDKKEEILMHESSHISSKPTGDEAYQADRAILLLSTEQALNNAQSVIDFILEMNGRARRLGPEHPDRVEGCNDNERSEGLVRKAIAWAERWNTDALFGTAQTYGNPSARAYMAFYHNAHFGRSDKAAIAAFYDRYRAMREWFRLFYNIRCVPASDPVCRGSRHVHWTLTRPISPSGGGPLPEPTVTAPTGGSGPSASATTTTPVPASSSTSATTITPTPASGSPAGATTTTPAPPPVADTTPATPGGEIHICPGFFSLGTHYDRVVEMHSGLAVHMPGVTESLSRSYARLAYNYRTKFWGYK